MSQPVVTPFKRPSPFAISLIIIGVLAVALISAAGVYTDWLWFDQLGYLNVFTTQILASALMFVIGALGMALITGLSLWLAYKTRPVYIRFPDQTTPFEQYRFLLDGLRKLVMIGIPAALGIFAGMATSAQWEGALTWWFRTPTGEVDAQFGMDVSFYLFELPFLSGLVGYFSAALLISAVLAAVVHLVYGSIRFSGRDVRISKAARVQIGITAALYLAVQGVSLWLDQFATMTSSAGLYTGATYSDVNATIPGFQILAVISGIVAVLFLIAAAVGQWRLPLLATALMVVSSLVLAGLYPWVVQTFAVVPNERTLESQYIQRNIEATRIAYGLDKVEVIEYQAKTDATPGALRADAETTASIRILDPALVSPSFKQLEQFRQYYGFASQLDVDRYEIDGKQQDTVIAVRELNQGGLGDSQSWFNNVIVYTHGYGVVAAYGNQRTVDGQPLFLQSGIPSKGLLGEYEPRVYFGERSPLYSIVGAPEGSTPLELDYPAGEGESDQTYTTFNGDGGPKIGDILSRLAYALKFQSEQILLSDAINSESQILYNRNPRDRVQAVAPYLTLDSDIYPAIVDSKLVWIVDGYTTSNQYPYSRAENLSVALADSTSTNGFSRGDINYIRNSVKATVDAYSGAVTLYAWDEADPILATWDKIFPNTLKSVTEMSGSLLSHVRYPADLFKVQRQILGSYHVTEAGAFYSQQDAWMTPNDPVGGSGTGILQPPYYLTMQAPGAKDPAFSIYSTFIPRSTGESSRNVLTGYLVATADAGNKAGVVSPEYGKLRLLNLPRTAIVPGPGQVQNNFNADSDVSRLLNILRQGSTKVLNGNLLTLPVAGGLLYVQPVYIQSTGETSFPLLKKVLVAFGDKIAFEDTLDQALDSLFGGDSGADAGDGSGAGGDTGTDPGTDSGTSTDAGTDSGGDSGSGTDSGDQTGTALQQALERARLAILEKQAAMEKGDWEAFGLAERKLEQAIADAIKAAG